MRKETIGKSNIEASVLVLGTWAIGGSEWGGTDEKESISAIHAAIDNGINFIDTAPIYGQGLSEEIVGKAIAGKRDDLVLATKVGLRWDIEEGEFNFEADGVRIFKNLKAPRIREEVESSLKRLGIDYIDLLQTHWPDSTTPVEETMTELLKLKAEGKVRTIGGCNLSPGLFDEYQAVGTLDSIQEMYSMIDRDLEDSLAPMAQSLGTSILAYSPMAMGLLTGKIDPERVFPADDVRSWSPRFTRENRLKIKQLLDRLRPYADEHGVTLAQFVLAWTTAQTAVTHVLCGARNRQQAEENAVAGNLELSSATLEAVEQILTEESLTLPHPFKS